jgi:hypothetical protein
MTIPTQVGVTGILLIFLNDGALSARPNSLFWHEVGQEYGGQLNVAVDQYVGNFSLRIDVRGNTYSAFVNDSSTPATTFISDKFTSGYVGLYDHDIFPGDVQFFDNFRLSDAPAPVPIPPPALRKRRHRCLARWLILCVGDTPSPAAEKTSASQDQAK